jgi:pilus assembly protein CpaB
LKSRLIAGLAAVVLAIVGVVLVFSYAQGADRRAMEGMEPVDVLVVQKSIPAGTPVETLSEAVAAKPVPAGAVAATSLKSLDSEAGKVTAVDLVAGEQLVSERLVDPASLEKPGSVPVPKGLQEVSFALDPPRTVGGQIAAGDTVGIFISFDGGALPDKTGGETTEFVFHKVLLTRVQKSGASAAPEGEGADETPAPTGSLLVTAAVDDLTATKIVFGAEFGRIWLSKEPADATEGPAEIIEKHEVYR